MEDDDDRQHRASSGNAGKHRMGTAGAVREYGEQSSLDGLERRSQHGMSSTPIERTRTARTKNERPTMDEPQQLIDDARAVSPADSVESTVVSCWTKSTAWRTEFALGKWRTIGGRQESTCHVAGWCLPLFYQPIKLFKIDNSIKKEFY